MSGKKRQKYVPLPTPPVQNSKQEVCEPPKKFNIKAKTAGQQDLLDAIDDCDIVVCGGPAGSGKALSLDSKIYTPTGFILNKDIKVGDIVSTPNNKTAKVTGVYPQKKKKMYQINFKDGSFVKCCEEHLWKVRICGEKPKVVNTKYLLPRNKRKSNGRYDITIDACEPIEFIEKDNFIDPYVLGVLISEGCITQSVTFTNYEKEVSDRVKNSIHSDYEMTLVRDDGKFAYRIKKRKKDSKVGNEYKNELVRAGLLGLKSYEKFIPKDYFYTSIKNRVALLQGLMDGDGTVSKHSGSPIYYTTSSKLKDDVRELVSSLGGTVVVAEKIPHFTYLGKKKVGKLCYILHICLPNNIECFSLERKRALRKDRVKYFPIRYVREIEYIGKDYSQCISIDSEEKMYLTNNFIQTHNTHLSLSKGFDGLKKGKYERLVLVRPLQECGRGIGFLPGELGEKIAPHMRAFTELFSHFAHPKEIAELVKTERLHIDTIEFMRGLTLHKSFIIVDEAQNCEYSQLKMLLTRMGHGSKMVVCGDIKQTDLPEKLFKDGKIPLDYVMDKLDLLDVPNIGIVELGVEDIVRHGLIKLICGVLP